MKKELRHYLGRAFGGTFVVYGAGVALAFASQVLLTRLLGADQYGNYYFVLAWVMALLIVAKLGLDSALLRFVPAYLARQQWGLLKGVLRWSASKAAWASLLSAGLLAVVVSSIPGIGSGLAQTFYLGCVVLLLLVYVYLRSALLRSLKHVVLALLPEAVIAPLVLGVSITLFWWLVDSDLNSVHAMAATLAGLIVSAFVGRLLLASRLPGQLQQAPALNDSETWLRSTRSMMLIGGAHVLLNNTDSIMLGLLRDAHSVGVYAVAAKSAILVSFPLTIANTTIAPLISRFHSTDDHAQLQQALDHSMRLVSLASASVFLAVLLFGREFLSIFGPEFVEAYVALVILSGGALVNALAGPSANLLSLTGSEGYVSRVMLTVTGLNIVMNLVFIPPWGIEGAAAATAISMVAWNLLMYITVRRRLGLQPNGMLGRFGVGR